MAKKKYIEKNYWEVDGSIEKKIGKPRSYTPDTLWEKALEYFQWAKDKVWIKKEPIRSGDRAGELIDVPLSAPLSLEAFSLFAKIARQTFLNYEKEERYFEVTTRIRTIIETNQFEGAVVGVYNPNIIARKIGLVDKTENNIKIEQPLFPDVSKNNSNK